jgi:hypothetical protein
MFERLLEPGCTERPSCACGEEMEIAAIETLPEGSDAAIRVYRCNGCHREMRLTVWASFSPPADGHVYCRERAEPGFHPKHAD